MKKLLCIFIALCLTAALSCVTVMAEGTAVFTLSEETANIGEEVALTFSVSENPGIAVMKFYIAFNPEALEPLSAEILDIFEESMFVTNLDEPDIDFSNYNNITFLLAQATNCYDNGDIAVFRFRVKDTAYRNVTVKLKYSEKDILNADHEIIEIQTENGMVEVPDADENAAASDDYDEFEIIDDQPEVEQKDPFENNYDFEIGKEYAETHPDADDNSNNDTGNPDDNTSGSTNETTDDGQNNDQNNTGNTSSGSGSNTSSETGSSGTGSTTGTGNNQTVSGNNGNDGTKTEDNTSDINDGTSGNGNTAGDIKVSYSDIANHWAKNAINSMSRKGIFKGYEDNTFRPNIGLSRQEMAVSVVRLLGLESELGTADSEKFTDDDEIADWAKDYVYLLVGKGIFKGYDDGSFGPRGIITREQLSLVLMRALENPPETLSEISFNDADKISDWAKQAVAAMVTLKIVNGYEDGTFRPQNDVTRAETCTMMYKFLSNR